MPRSTQTSSSIPPHLAFRTHRSGVEESRHQSSATLPLLFLRRQEPTLCPPGMPAATTHTTRSLANAGAHSSPSPLTHMSFRAQRSGVEGSRHQSSATLPLLFLRRQEPTLCPPGIPTATPQTIRTLANAGAHSSPSPLHPHVIPSAAKRSRGISSLSQHTLPHPPGNNPPC